MTIRSTQAGFAGLAVVLAVAGVGAGISYNTLSAARAGGTDAWRDLTQIHAERARLASSALEGAARAGGLDQAFIDQARTSLVRASALPTNSDVLNDLEAVDTYKRYQGELTGVLYRLAGTRGAPELETVSSLKELRGKLPQDELALAVARNRYGKSAEGYNALVGTFPGAAVAVVTGFRPLPAGL
ncbi:LemA family protein [Massilia sp. DJPM01]|uniref:LemA family protein n=1 Tax=Massilia sp. DJPM01 TaxID=3024404 RepID=UPI00259EF6D5|nr:LemA family protein [Massilia sp. DJPM01]MDM5180902.1 LemA family protein [Massilia sp. DJPM01]